ncbi:MAG: TIM barrel protein [Pirellulaceae bacterium]|jgi:sugar phosphate isomerase/epimerase|nr:TIM barrel protein [Pirellulaceae bacterium]
MDRRKFMQASLCAAAAVSGGRWARAADAPGSKMKFGLVTYLWGRDWDLPTLIANCEKAEMDGVELRSTHAHGVEPTLNAKERSEVKKRFADSSVVCAGLGSNERYDNPDPAVVTAAIEKTKAFLKLSSDVGSSGVKVKPDRLYPDVPRDKTIEQIGKSLNEVARYGADLGQQVRLEVHGGCAQLPTIKAIMDVADHPNATVCWNSNRQDLEGAGLEKNFKMVADRFGATAHIRELHDPAYPYKQLMKLLVDIDYAGFVMIEASTKPADRVAAMRRQRRVWEQLIGRRA